jgi:hypothetical protein
VKTTPTIGDMVRIDDDEGTGTKGAVTRVVGRSITNGGWVSNLHVDSASVWIHDENVTVVRSLDGVWTEVVPAQDQLRALDATQSFKDKAFAAQAAEAAEAEEPRSLLFMQKVTVSAQGGFLDFPELLKPQVEMALAALHDRITREGYTPSGEQFLAFYVEQMGEPA